MNKLKLLAGSALLVLAGTASAGDLILDGQVMALCENPTIDLDGGTISATTDCGGTTPVPPSVALTVSASNVDVGNSINVGWTVSNADSCTTAGGFGNWSNTTVGNGSGSVSITMDQTGDYTFNLSCTGDDQTVTRSRSVSVTDPSTGGGGNPVPTNCPDPLMPGQTVPFQSLFGDVWPEPNNNRIQINIPRGEYIALKINTGDAAAVRASHGFIENSYYSASLYGRVVQISQCPGDFSAETVDDACRDSISISDEIDWNLGPDSDRRTCDLEPNTDYYINMVFGYLSAPDVNTCESRTCRTYLKTSYSR